MPSRHFELSFAYVRSGYKPLSALLVLLLVLVVVIMTIMAAAPVEQL